RGALGVMSPKEFYQNPCRAPPLLPPPPGSLTAPRGPLSARNGRMSVRLGHDQITSVEMMLRWCAGENLSKLFCPPFANQKSTDARVDPNQRLGVLPRQHAVADRRVV